MTRPSLRSVVALPLLIAIYTLIVLSFGAQSVNGQGLQRVPLTVLPTDSLVSHVYPVQPPGDGRECHDGQLCGAGCCPPGYECQSSAGTAGCELIGPKFASPSKTCLDATNPVCNVDADHCCPSSAPYCHENGCLATPTPVAPANIAPRDASTTDAPGGGFDLVTVENSQTTFGVTILTESPPTQVPSSCWRTSTASSNDTVFPFTYLATDCTFTVSSTTTFTSTSTKTVIVSSTSTTITPTTRVGAAKTESASMEPTSTSTTSTSTMTVIVPSMSTTNTPTTSVGAAKVESASMEPTSTSTTSTDADCSGSVVTVTVTTTDHITSTNDLTSIITTTDFVNTASSWVFPTISTPTINSTVGLSATSDLGTAKGSLAFSTSDVGFTSDFFTGPASTGTSMMTPTTPAPSLCSDPADGSFTACSSTPSYTGGSVTAYLGGGNAVQPGVLAMMCVQVVCFFM